MRDVFRRFLTSWAPGRASGDPPRNTTLQDDDLTLPQRFCWYLARRSRSSRFLEYTAGRPGHLCVWHCTWPTEGEPGFSAPDARPALAQSQTTCRPARLPALLRAEPLAASVVLLSGSEAAPTGGVDIDELRVLSATTRYLVLCADATGPNEARTREAFANHCSALRIPPAFTGCIEQGGRTVCVALWGREAAVPMAVKPAKALALLRTYNEEDIIEQTVTDLLAQGLDAFVVDDGSTDSTVERLESLARTSGRVMLDRDSRKNALQLDYQAQSARLLEYADHATAKGYTWMMSVDADEIRRSPWPGVTLAEAFTHVETLGYNAVDFTVIDFRYARGQRMTPEPYAHQMQHFEFGRRPGHFVQIKAWRHAPTTQAALFPSGGHAVAFEGRRVYPLKFLLKHYPLRGLDHARKKIYQDRFPRYAPKQVAAGAHVQYDMFREREPVGWDVESLPRWDDRFHSRYLLERLSGIGLDGKV